MADALTRIRRIAREVRREFVPDTRVDIFEVRTRTVDGVPVVNGQTTVPAAADTFRARLAQLGVPVKIRLRLLPDPELGPRAEALIGAPIAPVYRRPTMNSTQLSQYVLGHRVTLLSRKARFWRIRGEDRHVGWLHRGYLVRGEGGWALAWERADGGEPMVSLGAELHDDDGLTFARLPWGSRVLRVAGGRILLPDGRTGVVGGGEVVPVDRMADRFPASGESIVRTARRWMGAPYLWGGVTPNGVDCSGLIQSVFWIHGLALPRDSDMQARVGARLDPGAGFERLRAGDLLFFAERNRVNHVAMSIGGARIIHAAASNGGVSMNDLAGDLDLEVWLRQVLHVARRLLPD
ncbi:MAG TPA: SH3 domain-containing C40 family peptidase [Longimicrobiales bacterium]|nr:SH3 domain-containing C40 family peptidase [Longimicrobiales bacterium]